MSRLDFDPARAAALQRRLASRVVLRDRIGRVRLIAGVDADFSGDEGRAAAVVLDARTLEPVEMAVMDGKVRVPYLPGFLAFRELPLFRRALGKLSRRPDLVIADGMGLLHPRRFGLACHLGLALDLPVIGCAKKPFIGEFEE